MLVAGPHSHCTQWRRALGDACPRGGQIRPKQNEPRGRALKEHPPHRPAPPTPPPPLSWLPTHVCPPRSHQHRVAVCAHPRRMRPGARAHLCAWASITLGRAYRQQASAAISHQPSAAIHHRSSAPISAHQCPSVAISGHQWPSVAISAPSATGHHWPSANQAGHQPRTVMILACHSSYVAPVPGLSTHLRLAVWMANE